MRRILFVDDQPQVEDAERRKFDWERNHWEVAFADGAKSAFKVLESKPFDVVVADVRAPASDAVTLLASVRDRFPGIVRIVLSSDLSAALRTTPIAHQFLLKPCNPYRLRAAVGRACKLKTTLNNEVIRRAVGSMGELPSLPRTYSALATALDDPDVSLRQVAKLIEQDVGLAVKVLRLVNSAFYGLAREISSIRTALSYLGLEVVRHLVLSVEVFSMFPLDKCSMHLSVESFEAHARLTASIGGRLPVPKHLLDATVVASLLHDVGKLVLASRLPGQLVRSLTVAAEEGRPVHAVEQELLGVTHAEIGAYLLGLWGLPAPIVEAVAHHHQPARVSAQGLDALAAVYLADALANEHLPCPTGPRFVHEEVDLDYLDALGAVNELPGWRAIAIEAAESVHVTPIRA